MCVSMEMNNMESREHVLQSEESATRAYHSARLGGPFVVAQLGARMRYAVPRILHQAGMLSMLYTDIWANGGFLRLARLIPRFLRQDGLVRLCERVPAGIPPEKIMAFNGFGIKYAARRRLVATPDKMMGIHVWAGKTFCEMIIEKGLIDAQSVYAFNGAALELCESCLRRGIRPVLEQTIAGMETMKQLLDHERSRFPGWDMTDMSDVFCSEMADREREERHLAELVVCGSEFVKESIAREAGVERKCIVVPYGVDLPPSPRAVHRARGALNVLTVGEVGLRKGSPYVLDTARRLKGKATFRMVGVTNISGEIRRRMNECVELVGAVPHSMMGEHYQWADVFLLPSICEGSARAVYEAMSYGLPVVCTRNTGSVIRDGQDGFIVPICDSDTIVWRLETLIGDPDLMSEMSKKALESIADFSIGSYGRRLLAALSPGGRGCVS